MTRSIFRSQQCLMDPSRFARRGPQSHEGQDFFGGVIKPPSVCNYPLMNVRLQEEIPGSALGSDRIQLPARFRNAWYSGVSWINEGLSGNSAVILSAWAIRSSVSGWLEKNWPTEDGFPCLRPSNI